jgi:hypothetical protein
MKSSSPQLELPLNSSLKDCLCGLLVKLILKLPAYESIEIPSLGVGLVYIDKL